MIPTAMYTPIVPSAPYQSSAAITIATVPRAPAATGACLVRGGDDAPAGASDGFLGNQRPHHGRGEAEVALGAMVDQLLGVLELDHLGAVALGEPRDHAADVALARRPDQRQRVRARELGAKAVLVQLDAAPRLDDPDDLVGE